MNHLDWVCKVGNAHHHNTSRGIFSKKARSAEDKHNVTMKPRSAGRRQIKTAPAPMLTWLGHNDGKSACSHMLI